MLPAGVGLSDVEGARISSEKLRVGARMDRSAPCARANVFPEARLAFSPWQESFALARLAIATLPAADHLQDRASAQIGLDED
jgi:hypothetical protein